MSTFAWLDYSEHDRQRAQDVLALFKEQEIRDELGIGVIRDAFSDLLFPGTSTLQTQARYFLFIPWLYLNREARRTPSAEIARIIRRDEVKLIEGLLGSGEDLGVIGREAGAGLKRMPSSIYWNGLGRLGIRLFPGSQVHYHRSLDRWYRARLRPSRADDGELLHGAASSNWHSGVPAPPEGFPDHARLALTRNEAEYLRDRWRCAVPGSLFTFLLDGEPQVEDADYPWSLPSLGSVPNALQSLLGHAREFAIAMHGAALLYNLMLSEAAGNDAWVEDYRRWLREWADEIAAHEANFARWDRAAFWALIRGTGARVGYPTSTFVNRWLEIAIDAGSAKSIASSDAARRLLRDRERQLKRARARLENRKLLEVWNGSSGAARLEYRWGRPARGMICEIIEGLAH